MTRKSQAKGKKHKILGGIKVSSQQLSKWGSLGGRPQKWNSEAERKRWERQQKKGSALRAYRSYGEEKIDKYLTCPHCQSISHDLGKYFNKQGNFITETYWFDTIKMEKTKIKENKFWCNSCHYSYSFKTGEIFISEVKTVNLRAGNSKERAKRFREKNIYNKKSPLRGL